MKRMLHGLRNWILVYLIPIIIILGSGESVRAQFGNWISVDLHINSLDWELSGVHFVSSDEGWVIGWENMESYGHYYSEAILIHCLFGDYYRAYLPKVGGKLYGIHFTSPNEGWVVGAGGLFHYLNGSWESVNPPGQIGILRGVHFTSPNEGWAVGEIDLLHYVNSTWVKVTPPELNFNAPLYGVHFTSSNEGWAVGGYQEYYSGQSVGILLHYLNGTWESVTPPSGSGILRSVQFISPSEGWALGNLGYLHYVNGTWTLKHCYTNRSCQYLGVHFLPTGQGCFVGSEGSYKDGNARGIIHCYRNGEWGGPYSNIYDGSNEPKNWELRAVYLTPYPFDLEYYQIWTVEVEKDYGSFQKGTLFNLSLLNVTAGPDLIGQWNALNQSCKTSVTTQCIIEGSFSIQNIGNQDALFSTVDFYLSDDDQYDEGDTFLKRVWTRSLEVGESEVKKLRLRLPVKESASGKYMIAVIDAEDVVLESDETNNVVAYGPIP